MKVSLTALCIGSLLFFASRARAETGVPYDTGPSCESAQPTVPATLPANVPGIPFVGVATDVSLVALDGTTVPATIGPTGADGYAIATWSASLAAGTHYAVRWSDGCGDHEEWFTATAESPLPTSAGTISATPRTETLPCDSEGNPVGAVSADVHLMPSAELAPFMVIAATDLVVDPEPSYAYGRRYGDSDIAPVGSVTQKCPLWPARIQGVRPRAHPQRPHAHDRVDRRLAALPDDVHGGRARSVARCERPRHRCERLRPRRIARTRHARHDHPIARMFDLAGRKVTRSAGARRRGSRLDGPGIPSSSTLRR